MTTQISDSIIVEGKRYFLNVEPLEQWFEQTQMRPKFAVESSACWRGYIATWEIKNLGLYLVDIDATLENGTDVNVELLFPNSKGEVKATWFTGVIVISDEKVFEHIDVENLPEDEQYLYYEIKRGRVKEAFKNTQDGEEYIY